MNARSTHGVRFAPPALFQKRYQDKRNVTCQQTDRIDSWRQKKIVGMPIPRNGSLFQQHKRRHTGIASRERRCSDLGAVAAAVRWNGGKRDSVPF